MDIQKYFSKVFIWMFVGLAITFLTGQIVASNPSLTMSVLGSGYWIIAICELITVIVLSARIHKMSPTGAKLAFIFYSVLSGLTFSSIFIVYQLTSIIYVFIITAVVMLVFGLLGYYTKLDLSKFGVFLLMALLAIIIASLLNVFIFKSASFDLGLNIIGILIFMGIMAYDVQNIKRLYAMNPDNENLAILGALELYLDFINVFIRLLEIFGKNND